MLLTGFRTDFTSSVWNFCRWVADVPPRETSPSAKREEKRMFSHGRLRTFQKGDPWYILKLGNHKIIETKAGMKKGMGVQIYFQGCSKCTCVWSIFPSHLEGKFSVENREISSETLQRVLVFPKLLYLPQPLKCVMKSLSWASGLSGRRYVWRNDARQCWM